MNESTVCTRVTRRVTLVTNPVISHQWVHCLYTCHPSCYSCYKPSDKSWMSALSVHVWPVVLLLLQTQWSVMNGSTVCTRVTRRVTLVTNPVISHEWVHCLYTCHLSCTLVTPSDNTNESTIVHVSRRVTLVTNPVISHEWVHCLYTCHPSCYSCYKPSDKPWMSPLSVHVSPVVLLLLQTQW